jgi:phenylpropionate dioxygenase-like ring-hydroxylating dioxygenase large terminal subunit
MEKDWVRPLIDADAFAAEQARLVGVWTFLGLASQAPNPGDWVRSSIGGRSVFVQRFEAGLKGFENLCRHRFHPLRTAEAGSGPIVCGYHHWSYDAEGRAVGIPRCRQLFGGPPAALDARLTPVEVALCGDFVFGRFAAAGEQPTLEAYLGDGFPILEAMSRPGGKRWSAVVPARANWRLAVHISLEGYHAVAVHPTSFGKDGYPDPERMTFLRFGPHCAQFSTVEKDGLARMAAACHEGTWRSRAYRIFHIFPNLQVSHFHALDQNWYVCVQQYRGLAHDRMEARCWLYPAPFAPSGKRPWHDRWTGPFTRPVRDLMVRRAHLRIMAEDFAVCERQQSVAAQVGEAPILGALEDRIAWFEEAYAEATAAGSPAASSLPPRLA